MKILLPLIISFALVHCGHDSSKKDDVVGSPQQSVTGGCSFRGPIMADPIKLGSADAANKAPSSWGEQCRDNQTQEECFGSNKKDDPLHQSAAWLPNGCSGLYVAKCPYKAAVYLYEGPSTKTEPGGLDTQKSAFVFACKTDGFTPEVR